MINKMQLLVIQAHEDSVQSLHDLQSTIGDAATANMLLFFQSFKKVGRC